MNTQEELRKEIVSLQEQMISLIGTVNSLFEEIKDNRKYISGNSTLLRKTAEVLKDLADIAGGTMKVDAEDIKVSNYINGGVPKIKKPTNMKDVGIVDLSTPKAQKEFLNKVEKLNNKYNES
jgi:hypothetical protein